MQCKSYAQQVTACTITCSTGCTLKSLPLLSGIPFRCDPMTSSKLPLPATGDRAHQPSIIRFPQREFGKSSRVKHSFQQQWFQRWPWLHYNKGRNLAFCFTCVVAYKNNHLHSTPFLVISTGFSYRKDAVTKFTKHENSQCHKDAVFKTISLPSTSKDVSEMLTTQLASERSQRRKGFLKLLLNACFLARQGLAFRGDSGECNFMRLLHLCAEDDTRFLDWLTKNTN